MQNSTSHIGLPFAAEHFTDPAAAVERVREIYDANTAYLRDCFKRFSAGEDIQQRVHACYPFVRVHTEIGTRVDTRLSYGFVAGPGTYATTVTRPDLFSHYFLEQFELLRRNHNVVLEVGVSRQPIPIHFAFPEGLHVEGDLSPERLALLRDSFDLPDLSQMDDSIVNGTHHPGAGRADAAGAVHRPAGGLLAPPAEALYGDIAGPFPELRAVHQLPVLYRRVHPAGHGDHVADRRPGPAGIPQAIHRLRRTGRLRHPEPEPGRRRYHGRPSGAPAADAGLPPEAGRRLRHHDGQHRRRPQQRQDDHRPYRRPAPARLDHARPLRRPAQHPAPGRLRAGPRLCPRGPRAGRRPADLGPRPALWPKSRWRWKAPSGR